MSPENETQLTALGITHEHVDQFNYRHYKYTKLNDALAQARRDDSSSSQILMTKKSDLPKHGITLESQECFRFNHYKYSNLKDAVAQAMRKNSLAENKVDG